MRPLPLVGRVPPSVDGQLIDVRRANAQNAPSVDGRHAAKTTENARRKRRRKRNARRNHHRNPREENMRYQRIIAVEDMANPYPFSLPSWVQRTPRKRKSRAPFSKKHTRIAIRTDGKLKLSIGASKAYRRAKSTSRKTGGHLVGLSRMQDLTFQRIGRVKQHGHSRVLLCDFDQRSSPRIRPFWAVCRIVGISPRAIRYDRTHRGWHVCFTLSRSLTTAECVALQCCMGSDVRRETLNLMRVIAIREKRHPRFWSTRWNLLFSEKLK